MLAIFFFAMLTTVLDTAPDLQSLQWKARVVVAFAPDEKDEQLRQQLRLLENEEHSLKERDTRVFVVVGNADEVQKLRQTFHCPPAGFSVVLIGKDGGAKLHRTHPVSTADLFQTIDRMPMRREEMGQKH